MHAWLNFFPRSPPTKFHYISMLSRSVHQDCLSSTHLFVMSILCYGCKTWTLLADWIKGSRLSKPSEWWNFSASPTRSTRPMTGCEARSASLWVHRNLFWQLQAWELYAHRRVYAPVKFTTHPKIYPACPKALSKKKKNQKLFMCYCWLSFWDRSAGACCLGEPISLGINFISGHAQWGSWSAIVIFECAN